jgi:AcrR family transcriptional regulator
VHNSVLQISLDHSTHVCNNFLVARTYRLQRRAERQAETRRRIVDAAVALHTSIGPAHTTVSAIAERAGVQRHTFYRHFPDEASLQMACSALWQERHPPPDSETWKALADPEARLRHGLRELYAFYAANADALTPLVRDAAVHPLTREILELRMRGVFEAMHACLAAPFTVRGGRRKRLLATIALYMDFQVWRTLREHAGSAADAVEAAARAILAQ